MIRTFILSALFLLSSLLIGQTISEDQSNFRRMVGESFPEKTSMLDEVFAWSDSLYGKQTKFYLSKLDSLSTDTINGSFFLPIVEMSKHHFYQQQGNRSMAIASIKKAQPFFNTGEDQQDYLLKTNKYMVSFFESVGETSFAMISQKRLALAHELKYEDALADHSIQKDSLTKEIESGQKKITLLEQDKKDTESKFLQAAAGAGVILITLIVILFLTRWSLKKKLQAAVALNKDTTEKDVLNARIQELNAEITQYKHTAQLTINKLNQVDVSNKKVTQSLTKMTDELNKALDEINQQNEQQKATSSPATYMLVRNTIARTTAIVEEHLRQAISLLQ